MHAAHNDVDELIVRLRDALVALDRPTVEALFDQAASRYPPLQVAEKLIVPALARMGEEWNAGTIALSQIYMSSRICEDLVTRVLPPMASERKAQPRHAIVVLSNYHLLGKRIVLSVMRASGFETLDYGRMDVDELVERIIADDVKILLVSVLLLPAALKVRALREALVARGRHIRIVVGGAPFLFDPQLWREVGADAMGRNAADAVAIVGRWMEEAA
ncbi:MAG TPA: cobalamin-dependent protein [Noviherbaspirillum sp.]